MEVHDSWQGYKREIELEDERESGESKRRGMMMIRHEIIQEVGEGMVS